MKPLNLGPEQELIDLGIYEGLTTEELILDSELRSGTRQVKRSQDREEEKTNRYVKMYGGTPTKKKSVDWSTIVDDLE